jgi:tripartite-type tricarboxylate transporter receptor subunit TctC
VIIENRAGAGGALGSKAVAVAEPDGYTLLFGNASALVVGPAVYRFRDYDTVKHFAPIAKVTEGYEVLVVAPDFPAKNVQELVAYAKAHPGKLNFGSMGYGNLTHLAAELFKLRTGTDFVHVPYKGSPKAVAGIVAGEVTSEVEAVCNTQSARRAALCTRPLRSAGFTGLRCKLRSDRGFPGRICVFEHNFRNHSPACLQNRPSASPSLPKPNQCR